MEEKAPVNDLKQQFPVTRYTAASKMLIASSRCYDNSDVVATLIITNFHLYLIQLWWYYCGGNFSKSLFMST